MKEITVRGMVLSTAPQGEYGRRAVLLTDRLGKITAFASGAAKTSSKIIGAVRPMTCAGFTLAKGRSAYNLHTVELIDSFEELALDFERSVYAAYVLETGEYFSADGMPEDEAKALLNLMFVTMKALRESNIPMELIRRIYELRLLMIQGEYTLLPESYGQEETAEIWRRCLSAPLTALYEPAFFAEKDCGEFEERVAKLFGRQINHAFRSLSILRDL